MKNWPKLTETLTHASHPSMCTACGETDMVAPKLERWQECDENDQPTRFVVVLCPGCVEKLIERHPRLYIKLPEHKPHAGTHPEAGLCIDCPHRAGLVCMSPLSIANGGPGFRIIGPAPARGFWDGRDPKTGKRTGGMFERYPGPPTVCEGRNS